MGDVRFTTVAEDMDELIEALDVDDVDDLETLLIFLFQRPITVEASTDDDDESSFEVVVWDDTMGTGTRYAFPLTMMDLARGCALTVSDLQSTEEGDRDEDGDLPDLQVMDDKELIATLQSALGKVRLFNMLHDDKEA